MTDFDRKTDITRPGLTNEDKRRLIAERNQKRRESLRNVKIESEAVRKPSTAGARSTLAGVKTTGGSVSTTGARTSETGASGSARTTRPSTATTASGAVRTGATKTALGTNKSNSTYATDVSAEVIMRRRAKARAEAAKAGSISTEEPVRKPTTVQPKVTRTASAQTSKRHTEAELRKKNAALYEEYDEDEASEEEILARFGKTKKEMMGGNNLDGPKKSRTWLYIKRALIAVGSILAVVLVWFISVLLIVNYGPSNRAHATFVKSMQETSALKFVAKIFTTDEEYQKLIYDTGLEVIDDVTDEDLIHIGPTSTPTAAPTSAGEVDVTPVPTEAPIVIGDASKATLASDGRMYENLISDEDGIIIVSVSGSTYKGHMMIVLDPSRVIVGVCNNVNDPGSLGQKLTALIEKYDGVAGTNAGGFEDTGGTGTGSVPLGPTFSEGKLIKSGSSSDVMIGFNEKNVLMVGYMNADTAKSYGIRDAVSFGPALIINGKAASSSGVSSGLNPRTAIGQREDGAVLLLVIDGRQASSLGASYADLIDEFQKFGAVNAANLDGGSSSQMYYNGEPVNSRANLIREREMPTAIIVKKSK